MECGPLQKPTEQVDLFQSGLNLQLDLSLKYSFAGLINLYRPRRQIYSKSYFGNKEVLPDTVVAAVDSS
jgi:hypothetical protein